MTPYHAKLWATMLRLRGSEHAAQHGGKPWRYKLIPETKINRLFDFGGVLAQV